MKQIIVGAVITVVVLLAAVYFIDGDSEAPTQQRRAPSGESYNLN